MITAQAIIDFWFNELTPQQWFAKDHKLDQLIKDRYSEIHHQAHIGELESWRHSAQSRLAEIIILDQFSRSIYRDQARAFASDPAALILAQEALRLEVDKNLPVMKKAFLYMPFMHSESLMMQDKALELFDIEGLEGSYNSSKEHREIIERFGRFPHRNEILGRKSTPDEIDFLLEHAGF